MAVLEIAFLKYFSNFSEACWKLKKNIFRNYLSELWRRLGGGSWENYLLHWLTHLLGHSYIKLDFIIYFGQSSAAITPSDDVWIRKTHLGEKKMEKIDTSQKSKITFFSIWSRYVKGVSKFRSQWHSTNTYVHCSYLLIVWIPCW